MDHAIPYIEVSIYFLSLKRKLLQIFITEQGLLNSCFVSMLYRRFNRQIGSKNYKYIILSFNYTDLKRIVSRKQI